MKKPLIIGKEKIFDYKIVEIENIRFGIICPSLNLIYERTKSGDNSEALTEHAFAVFFKKDGC